MNSVPRMVLTRVGIVHRFLLAQESRLLVAMLALATVPWLIEFGQDLALFADRHVLREIRPELGLAASARIPDVVKPAVAERGFRVCESRRVLRMRRLRATRIGHFLIDRVATRFPEFDPLLFRCFHASLGVKPHEAVRRVGEGFHDYDGEVLRFSSSDGSNPAGNGRVYLVAVPAAGVRTMVEMAGRASIALFALFACVLVRKRTWPWIRECYRSDTFPGAVAVAVINTGIVLLVSAILMEAYLRWRIPFMENDWPVRFDPRVGFVLQPNARVRWTNNREFWVEQTSNSLGFLDREPAVPKPDGTFRVLVIGDSVVEAAQVGPTEKMHVLLEARLRGALDALDTDTVDKVDTAAFGVSGTGQSNQLSYYDRYGADIDADLVVLLVVSNDFHDNSTLLQGISRRWDPYRPPMLFHEPDESGETFTRVGIDADWANHRLARGEFGRRRREIMERYPETRALFGDWLPDEPVDCLFYADEPPPVFQRALASTEHALRLFRERTENRGEALLLVITPGIVTSGEDCADDSRRTFDTRNKLKRITGIAERVGIPVLDLYPAFAERGDWRDTEFAIDGHWNALGHRWAAEALAGYLLEHRELLSPGRRRSPGTPPPPARNPGRPGTWTPPG